MHTLRNPLHATKTTAAIKTLKEENVKKLKEEEDRIANTKEAIDTDLNHQASRESRIW